MARDPFTYFLELRRRYVRDWYWMCAAVIAIGLGIAVNAGTSHLVGMVAGVGLMIAGSGWTVDRCLAAARSSVEQVP